MSPITVDILHKLFPSTRTQTLEVYVDPLNKTFDKNGFNTINRRAGFLSEVGFESQFFTRVEENLNYSAEGLVNTFHVDAATAALIAHNPIKIANRVYANKIGNGNEASGDGWKYHGRGLIQLTGKENYENAAKGMGVSIDSLVDKLIYPEEAVNTAVWYWLSKGLHSYCDRDDFTGLTKHINSALLGLSQRKAIYDSAKVILK